MHGPCGEFNLKNICMEKKRTCKNHYPTLFCSETRKGENSYPIYRRRDNGQKVKVRGHYLDNQWVIPYNSYEVC